MSSTEMALGPARTIILNRLMKRFSSQEGLLPVVFSDGSMLPSEMPLRAGARTGGDNDSPRKCVVTPSKARSMLSFLFAHVHGINCLSVPSATSISGGQKALARIPVMRAKKLTLAKCDINEMYSVLIQSCTSVSNLTANDLSAFNIPLSRDLLLPLLVASRSANLLLKFG